MQTNKILSAPLIDLIFDGHNKEYGAYELRKNYSKRINRALIITMAFATLLCGGAIMATSSKKNNARYKITSFVELKKLPDEKKPEKLPEPEKKPDADKVKTVINTAPEIRKDEDVQKPPPTQDELIDAKIGTEKIDGRIDDGIPRPDQIDKGNDIVERKVDREPDEPIGVVEIDAKFIGNWVRFLEKNLNPNVPVDNGAPAGRYSVVIQFVVDREGNVSDLKALTNHGFGLEEEAIRVLRKAPQWEPAIQNGIKVKAYRKQVITFEVNEEG